MLRTAVKLAVWHADSVELFETGHALLGVSIESGWSGRSGDALSVVLDRWRKTAEDLTKRIEEHSNGLAGANTEFVGREQQSAEKLSTIRKTPLDL